MNLTTIKQTYSTESINYKTDIKVNNENNEYSSILNTEAKIFFTRNKQNSLANFAKPKDNIISIDKKHTSLIDSFLIYSKTTIFKKTLTAFINDIKYFEKLACFYLPDEPSKIQLQCDIKQFIYKIRNIDDYQLHGNSIIKLFTNTRNKIHILVDVLTTLKNQQQQSGFGSIYNMLANEKIVLENNLLPQLILECVTDINLCFAGVSSRFDKLYYAIEALISGKRGLVATAKTNLVSSFARGFEKQLIKQGKKSDNLTMSVHYNIALTNKLVKKIGVEYIEDKYASYDLDILTEAQLFDLADIEISPAKISQYLAMELYDKFRSLLASYNLLEWLHQDIPLEDLNVSDLFAEIEENFIAMCNSQYEIINDKDKLNFYTIFTETIQKNTSFYSAKGLASKLHGWVARSLLPNNNQRILYDISNHLLTTNDKLAIASLGSCYFWVIDTCKLNHSSSFDFDFDNYIELKLNHIDINAVSHLPKEIYRSLIIQAFEQTNNANKIVDFFSTPDTYKFLHKDLLLLKYLNNILSSKITCNNKLKMQLLEIITNKNYLDYTAGYKFKISAAYWFIDSKLLEFVLLNFAENSIDIYDCINQFSIDQIINLNTKKSLKHILAVAKKSFFTIMQESKLLNINHFYKLAKQLMYFGDSIEITKLSNSGVTPFKLKEIDVFGRNLLMLTAKYNDPEGMELLINNYNRCYSHIKVNLNMQDAEGSTALIYAAESSSYECMKLLLKFNKSLLPEQSINLNINNNKGNTALMAAIKLGNDNCVEYLINHGADINKSNYLGFNALSIAVWYNKNNYVKYLIEKRVNIHKKNSQGYNALMAAAYKKNIESIRLLVQVGINVNECNKQQFTALMLAVENGDLDCVKALIKFPYLYYYSTDKQKLLDLSSQCIEDDNILMLAAYYGHVECVEFFANSSNYSEYVYNNETLDINAENKYKETALSLAKDNKHYECVKILKNYGAKNNLQNSFLAFLCD